MFAIVKIAGLSAVLSAGLVTAYNSPVTPAAASGSGKIYLDRVPQADAAAPMRPVVDAVPVVRKAADLVESTGRKGDRLDRAPAACTDQTWPNIARECLTPAGGTPVRAKVRTVTIEQRDGAATSVLVRIPAAEIAAR